MMKTIRSLMALAIAVVTFAACSSSDDVEKYVADVNVPTNVPTTSEGYLLLEAGAHEFTLNIKTEGQWTVTSQNRFLHVKNGQGTGNATVTVAVQNNRSDDRKLGTLLITFPGHESENKTITVEQKYLGDYGGNAADTIGTNNKIYAVGYSYDTTNSYANPNSVRLEVFDTKAMMDDKVLAVNTAQGSLVENTITGSSISEMSNKLSVKASVEGSYCGFKGEVKASFDMTHTSSSNYEYAITYLDLGVRYASLNRSLEALKDEYMTDDAWNDINGVPVKNKKGISKVRYKSNDEGFKELINAYGTHVIIRAGLGGRIRRSMEVDISKITSSYDVKAFAKASYSGAVDVSAEVDENYKQSFKDNRQQIDINTDVLGGKESLNKALATKDGFTRSNVDAWIQSVTKDNMALTSFDEGSLIPIYDLVERNATVENGGFNGEERYRLLKGYIDNNMGKDPDFSYYNCGTVFEFNIPTFENKWNNTLIKDIYCDGHWVAQVCNEYIPELNRDERVTVVYPVIVNQPRYYMGFFLGNDSHKPARVAWSGTSVSIEEYDDLDFGKVSKLYLRGASIKTAPHEGMETKICETKEEYLQGLKGAGTNYQGEKYNYPIVKIFNNIWIRENYKHEVYVQPHRDWKVNNETLKEVYYRISLAEQACPSGWRLPNMADYQNMVNKLTRNGHSLPGLACSALDNNVTGFSLYFPGYYGGNWGYGTGSWYNNDYAYFLTTDEPQLASFTKGGQYENSSFNNNAGPETSYFSVRYVKE